MKESCRKGVANHPDPEPCEGGREAVLEALDRGICRLGIPEVDELRNREIQGADGVTLYGRQPGGVRQRKCIAGPAESKTPGMHRNWGPSGHARTERPRYRPWSVGHGPLGEGDEL